MPKKNRSSVKQGVTKQTQQRREAGVQLRQSRRQDNVNKRRRGGSPEAGPREDFETRYANDKITKLIYLAGQNEPSQKGVALTQLRLLLLDDNAPIARFMQAGIMGVLTHALVEGKDVDHQHEALWCLTNIACDAYEYTKQVFALAPHLIALLGCGNAQLQEQAAWCLANLAGEDAELRQQLFDMRVVGPLVALLGSERDKTAQLAAWALVNLMKGPSFPAEAFLETDVLRLIGARLSSNDDALLMEILWILAGLIEVHQGCIDLVCAGGLVPGLFVVLLNQTNPLVLMPAFRAVALVIKAKQSELTPRLPTIIPIFIQNLQSFHVGAAKETAVALATLASEPGLAQSLVPVIPVACSVFIRARFDIRKELAFLLLKLALLPNDALSSEPPATSVSPSSSSSSLVMSCSPCCASAASAMSVPPLIRIANSSGVIDTFLELLKSADVDAILSGLNFIELVLRRVPKGVMIIEEKRGIELLETFQTSQNEELYNFAMGLVDEFYGEDYGQEEEDQMREPVDKYPPWRQQPR